MVRCGVKIGRETYSSLGDCRELDMLVSDDEMGSVAG